MQIIVPAPKNLTKIDSVYFDGKDRVTINEERVRDLKNVFVSHEGLVVKNGLFVPRSAYNMFGSEDNTHFWEMFKLSTEQYWVAHLGKSVEMETLNASYLLIHSKWFNFYFWITSCLYRLLLTESRHKELTLILPDGIGKFKFVQDTLKMFPNLKTHHVKPGLHLKVEHLIFPECRKWTISLNPKTIKKIKEKVLSYAQEHFSIPDFGDKIYISRAKTGKREFTNNAEVSSCLVDAGFVPVLFEDYSIFEQALILAKAKYVIGLHGAGFTNIIYMNPPGALFELIAEPPAINEHRIGYWRLSGIIGISYYYQFCKIDVDPTVEEILNNNITVNVELLKENVGLMLKEYDESDSNY